ncbi:hypothetical protein OYC64_009055 [Pagothenia borchgrevinki]|uniref:Major facilitator superfamily (MFS) profile domain-containing protein n=1 Tax=Pagothenia borchgrevinki TaxID=8213 RepID=A0ABD2G7M2_PAGBO
MDSQLSADPPLEPRPPRMTRQQILTLISVASVNFSSMICYSILGPFFPTEAVKKGASQTVIGLIFGCYAVFNLIASLIMGKYIVQIGAKFMLVAGLFVSAGSTIMFGLLTRVPPRRPLHRALLRGAFSGRSRFRRRLHLLLRYHRSNLPQQRGHCAGEEHKEHYY